MKASGNLAGSVREVVTQGAVDDGGAVVGRGGGWPWLLAGLEAHILKQGRFGEVAFGNVAGVMNTLPPTKKVQQLMCIVLLCHKQQNSAKMFSWLLKP